MHVYAPETVTTMKMMSMSLIPRSLFMPLCDLHLLALPTPPRAPKEPSVTKNYFAFSSLYKCNHTIYTLDLDSFTQHN